eukprot:615545_1
MDIRVTILFISLLYSLVSTCHNHEEESVFLGETDAINESNDVISPIVKDGTHRHSNCGVVFYDGGAPINHPKTQHQELNDSSETCKTRFVSLSTQQDAIVHVLFRRFTHQLFLAFIIAFITTMFKSTHYFRHFFITLLTISLIISVNPTTPPTQYPTMEPTNAPTTEPTNEPTMEPTILCPEAKYHHTMSFSSTNNENDFLCGGESLLSANCRVLLTMKSSGDLVMYSVSDQNLSDLTVGWATNTRIHNNSGEGVVKLILRNGGLKVLEYVYPNVPSFAPIILWDSKDTLAHTKGLRKMKDLTLVLSDKGCLLLHPYGKTMDIHTALWFVCGWFDHDTWGESDDMETVFTTEWILKDTQGNEGETDSANNDEWVLWTTVIVIVSATVIFLCIRTFFYHDYKWIKSPKGRNSSDESEIEMDEAERINTQKLDEWFVSTTCQGGEREVSLDEIELEVLQQIKNSNVTGTLQLTGEF